MVTCACGHTFMTGSTRPTLRVDICSNCHPFYTGKKRIVDTAGRVDRFNQKRTSENGAPTAKSGRR